MWTLKSRGPGFDAQDCCSLACCVTACFLRQLGVGNATYLLGPLRGSEKLKGQVSGDTCYCQLLVSPHSCGQCRNEGTVAGACYLHRSRVLAGGLSLASPLPWRAATPSQPL